jgi:predicted GH43/DUF377 family glycosyl hydrolase
MTVTTSHFQPQLWAAFNGQPSANAYKIGIARSFDGGITWEEMSNNPVLQAGSGWEATCVKDPRLVNCDGRMVMYYAGFDGSTFQIGRATSGDAWDDLRVWNKDAGNPVIAKGTNSADPDYVGCEFPIVTYQRGETPQWRCWYAGYPNGSTPPSTPIADVCYADSTDGITWTKRGIVIARGASGAFDDSAAMPGAVIKVGAVWYIYYAGYRATAGVMYSALASCTDPANAATYTKLGVMENYDNTITWGGNNYQSNMVNGVIAVPSGYRAFITIHNPGEICVTARGDTLQGIGLPTAQLLRTAAGTWTAIAAENPSVVRAI